MSAAAAAGRRPGNADTRGEIIEAAKRVFAAKGYDGASLRAVAREAEVDPALVHHYFDGKASLFVAAMALPFDPRTVQDGHSAATRFVVELPERWSSRAFSPCGTKRKEQVPRSLRVSQAWRRRPAWPTPCASSWPSGSGARAR